MRARRPERRFRRGVTLLELMVALSVAGLALVAARVLVEQIDDAGRSLTLFTRTMHRTANGDRVLRALASRAEVSSDSLRRFRGDTASASFDTWCERPTGWMERCRVDLIIGAGRDSSAITGVFSTGEVLHLQTIGGVAAFRYVARDSSGFPSFRAWGQSITAPYALVVESDQDTVILVVGDRG